MARATTSLGPAQTIDAKGHVVALPTHRAGWLKTDPPKASETLVLMSRHVWSELYYGIRSRIVYKHVKKTNEWFSFVYIQGVTS